MKTPLLYKFKPKRLTNTLFHPQLSDARARFHSVSVSISLSARCMDFLKNDINIETDTYNNGLIGVTFVPTTAAQVVFYAAFGMWLVFTFLIEPVIIRSTSTKSTKKREDKGSGLLIYISVFVSIITAFQFAGANIMPLPEWLFVVGICLMMLGIFVREWAVTTLRGFFLFTVGVRQDHKVIENGPYRLVRHPAYSGSILTMVGLGLATQSAVAVLILAVVCGIAYGYRIHVEKPALKRELGEEYLQYMSRTKRLIPFVF